MVSFKNLRKMIEIKGNGNIVSREINVSSFIRLHLGGCGLVELHQGDEEKVIVETDENLQSYFAATNAGRTLYVGTETSLRRLIFTSCIIKVYVRQMNTLYVRMEKGSVVCPSEIILTEPLKITVQSEGDTQLNLNVPAIKILCQTEGNTTLMGECEKIDIKNMSEGFFNSKQLKAGELYIKNMSEGNVDLYAEKTIRMKHYGEGYMHYYGPAKVIDVLQYGEGEIKHMKTETVNP
jgi:hypothetical protein